MSLTSAIRAAVGGRTTRKRLEENKPEELEDDRQPDEAEDEDNNREAETDEEQAQASEDEPAAQEDEDQSGEYARGRKAERSRMSAILGSEKAEHNPNLAAHLAFNTSMSAKQALATLSASGAARSAPSLSGRMANRVPALGNGGAAPKAGSADERLIAHAKVRAASRKPQR